MLFMGKHILPLKLNVEWMNINILNFEFTNSICIKSPKCPRVWRVFWTWNILLTATISFRIIYLKVALAHPFQESWKFKYIKIRESTYYFFKVVALYYIVFFYRFLRIDRNKLELYCKIYFNLRMKGVKPSSSSGSQSSFIKPLASSLESFSPKTFINQIKYVIRKNFKY